MARAASNVYSQTVIGICGHPCDGWPQVSGIGGSDPLVCCDECTREEYGIPAGESLNQVWVRIKPEKKERKKGGKREVPNTTKQPAFWEQFLV